MKGQDTKYEGKQVDKRGHYCDSTGAHKPGQNCPAYGKQCLKCSKYNHFVKCCNSELRQNIQMNRQGTRHNPNGQRQQQHRVKKTTKSSSQSDKEFLQQAAKHVYPQVKSILSDHETNTVRLRIADLDANVEPDGRVSVNIMRSAAQCVCW